MGSVEIAARAGAVEAVPALKERFVRAQDANLKAKLASGLIRLGVKDDVYWDSLAQLASQAIESDAPDFFSYDARGKATGGPSPALVEWARDHNVPIEKVVKDVGYPGLAPVLDLAVTGDPRGIPLLRRGLLNPNTIIEHFAALGLAQAKDEDSIPLIIEACKKAPADAASSIAESLVYFDDAAAQKAVDEFMPMDYARTYREARAKGKTPFQ